MSSYLDRWSEQIHAGFAKVNADAARQKLLAEFDALDERELASLSDKTLAFWQAKFPEDSPQALLARYEWQRRLTGEQVRATRFAAWVGLVGVVVGACIGAALTVLIGQTSKDAPKESTGQNSATSSAAQSKNAVPKPEAPAASTAVTPNVAPAKQK